MEVFKFGGASVKDAEAVKNVAHILHAAPAAERVVVISAMGKTTNMLEEVLRDWFDGRGHAAALQRVGTYHRNIMEEVFASGVPEGFAFDTLWAELEARLDRSPGEDFDFEYDQVVSYGELFSTAIVAAYLESEGFKSEWVDVRNIIRTDSAYRKARVDWARTRKNGEVLKGYLADEDCEVVVTQGFIAKGNLGNTTTLGREGSDFSASILAHITDAQTVTIWKDVRGMQNADPSWFNNTVRLPQISYREAIELSYYGASVIHPKTIQPLQDKGIDLHVKSFLEPEEEGTIIQANAERDHLIPSYIFKPEQILVSVSRRDLAFVGEQQLSGIFATLDTIGLNINMMQLSALNFSFVMDNDTRRLERLRGMLSEHYEVRYNEGMTLLTVRHYDEPTLSGLVTGNEVLLEQKTRSTIRLVMRPETGGA